MVSIEQLLVILDLGYEVTSNFSAGEDVFWNAAI
jgi:hypothetical protein